MQVVDFTYDSIFVSTTVDEQDDEKAAFKAAGVLRSYGLDPEGAYHIEVNGSVYEGPVTDG